MKEYVVDLFTTIRVAAESADEAVSKALEVVSVRDLSAQVDDE